MSDHPDFRPPAPPRPRQAWLALLVLLALGGCGGGGGGGGGAGVSAGLSVAPPSSPPPVTNLFVADCSGDDCGALNDNTYAGSGVGIWRYSNTTGAAMPVQVSLSGTLGREVTLILTNLADSTAALDSGGGPSFFGSARAGDPPQDTDDNASETPPDNRIPDRIRHFEPPALVPRDDSSPTHRLRASSMASALYDSRTWYDHQNDARIATLQMQRTIGGRQVNFWVQNGEYGTGRVSETQLTALADAFASGGNAVYSMVTGLAGAPWGSHPYVNLISDSSSQPINIVLLNLTPDSLPYGLVGFFWGRDVYLRSTPNLPANSPIHYSNEALAFFLDTETLYRAPNGAIVESVEGLRFEISTLAHELVHMINFYQRFVLRSQTIDYSFDDWLEEMSALMMEDIVGLRLDPLYHVIRDDRFPRWVAAGNFNCDITQFDDSTTSPCFGYNLAGSFGAWLLRHYGIDFYKGLLANTSSTDSVALLDNAIRAAGGAGFKDAVRRWGTLLALLPAADSPPLFGLPERSEQGFTLPAIDGAAYVNTRQLPSSAPTSLVPNGHFPQRRTNVANTFFEEVTVPPQTTLTVIVQ